MPFYENVFIVRQDASKSQVDAMTEKYTSIINEMGGKIEKTEYWGLRNLAYKIEKNRKGHYTLMNIDAPSDAIAEMERKMKIDESVIRYMTIKVEELESEPSIIMSSRKGEDTDRLDEILEETGA